MMSSRYHPSNSQSPISLVLPKSIVSNRGVPCISGQIRVSHGFRIGDFFNDLSGAARLGQPEPISPPGAAFVPSRRIQ